MEVIEQEERGIVVVVMGLAAVDVVVGLELVMLADRVETEGTVEDTVDKGVGCVEPLAASVEGMKSVEVVFEQPSDYAVVVVVALVDVVVAVEPFADVKNSIQHSEDQLVQKHVVLAASQHQDAAELGSAEPELLAALEYSSFLAFVSFFSDVAFAFAALALSMADCPDSLGNSAERIEPIAGRRQRTCENETYS